MLGLGLGFGLGRGLGDDEARLARCAEAHERVDHAARAALPGRVGLGLGLRIGLGLGLG